MASCCGCLCCCCVGWCLFEACGHIGPGTTTAVVSVLALVYWYLPDIDVYTPSAVLEESPDPLYAAELPYQWLLPVLIALGVFLAANDRKKKAVWVYLALWYLKGGIGDLEWLLGSVASSIAWFFIDVFYFASAMKELITPILNPGLFFLASLVCNLLYTSFYHRDLAILALLQLYELPAYSWGIMLPAVYFSAKYAIVCISLQVAGGLLIATYNYLLQGQTDLGKIASEGVSAQFRYDKTVTNDSVLTAVLSYFLAFLSAAGAISVLWITRALFAWTIEEVPWILDAASTLCFPTAAALSMAREVHRSAQLLSILSALLAVWISIVLLQTVHQALTLSPF